MSAILSAADLDRASIEGLITAARIHRDGPSSREMSDVLVALVFFEDSLRTRVGFEAAAARLGARTTTVLGPKHTARMSAAESLEDIMRCLEPACDAICLRHPEVDAPRRAAAAVATPLVNCGNGDDEHPTQALVDLFAIAELRGEIDGVSIALVGDLCHMRAAHSLLGALSHFAGVCVRCVSPPLRAMPTRYAEAFVAAGNELEQTAELELGGVDIVYMAGLPAHTPAGDLDESERARFRLDPTSAARLQSEARILCPMPRVDEIAAELDDTPAAAWFLQNALGIAMRTAILEHVIGPRDGATDG